MKKDLKRFLLVALVVLSIVFSFDYAFGKVMDWVMPRIGVIGEMGKLHYAITEIENPVLIVGSSRAVHHYDPKVLSDSLNKDVYNIGIDGCFFSHNTAVVNSILERYSPELIIWEFSPDYLYGDVGDLSDLYRYYTKVPYINKMLDKELEYDERIRLKSNLYQYNSKLHRVASRFLSPGRVDSMLGYLPLDNSKIKVPLKLEKDNNTDIQINQRNVSRFKDTVEKIKNKGSKVILVDSPVYYLCTNKEHLLYMQRLCDSLNVTFIDNSQLNEFLDHPEYFKDKTHLNKVGARRYTEIFITQIKGRI